MRGEPQTEGRCAKEIRPFKRAACGLAPPCLAEPAGLRRPARGRATEFKLTSVGEGRLSLGGCIFVVYTCLKNLKEEGKKAVLCNFAR